MSLISSSMPRKAHFGISPERANNVSKLKLDGDTFKSFESVKFARDTITHMGFFDTLCDQLFDHGAKRRALELIATKVLCHQAAEWLRQHPKNDIPFDALALLTGLNPSHGHDTLHTVNRGMILAQCKLFDLVHPDGRELLAEHESIIVEQPSMIVEQKLAGKYEPKEIEGGDKTIVFWPEGSDDARELLTLRWPVDRTMETKLEAAGESAFSRLREVRYFWGHKAGEPYADNPAHWSEIREVPLTLTKIANMVAQAMGLDEVRPEDGDGRANVLRRTKVYELRAGIQSTAAALEKNCREMMAMAQSQKRIQILPIGITERGFSLEDHVVLLICDPSRPKPLIVDSKFSLRGYPNSIDWIVTGLQSLSDITTCGSHVAQQCLHYTYMLDKGVPLAFVSPYGIPGTDD